jgi:hypothetical protein
LGSLSLEVSHQKGHLPNRLAGEKKVELLSISLPMEVSSPQLDMSVHPESVDRLSDIHHAIHLLNSRGGLATQGQRQGAVGWEEEQQHRQAGDSQGGGEHHPDCRMGRANMTVSSCTLVYMWCCLPEGGPLPPSLWGGGGQE